MYVVWLSKLIILPGERDGAFLALLHPLPQLPRKRDCQIIQFNLPDPIVLARGVVNDCLSALSLSAIPSPDGDADNWGAGGGGIANLSCSCLDSVEAAGATVGNSMLPAI